MKSIVIIALVSLFSTARAHAAARELYHCTVNNVSDGFFQNIDLRIDGENVGGSAEIKGKEWGIGNDLVGFLFTDSQNLRHVAVVYKESRDRTETISFALSEVVSKLGPATRYSTDQGAVSLERQVEMICDIPTPD